MSDPAPLSDLIAGLTERVSDLAAGFETAVPGTAVSPEEPPRRSPPERPIPRDLKTLHEVTGTPLEQTADGTWRTQTSGYDGLGQVKAAKVQHAQDALAEVARSLEDAAGDDPESLTGSPAAQVLRASQVLDGLNAERAEDGGWPTRAQETAYAAWAKKRNDLEDSGREHVAALTGRLDDVADTLAWVTPQPPPAEPAGPTSATPPRRSVWT